MVERVQLGRGVAPAPASTIDTLSFPTLPDCIVDPFTSPRCQSTNDLAGLEVDQLTLPGGTDYTFAGDGIAIGAGGLSLTATTHGINDRFVELPLTLASDQTWTMTGPPGGALNETGMQVLDLSAPTAAAFQLQVGNGAVLNLRGDVELGPVSIVGQTPGAADGNGGVALNRYPLDAPPSQLNNGDGQSVTVTNALLQASGSVGPLTVQGGVVNVGLGNGEPRTLAAPSATFDAASTVRFYLYHLGWAPDPGSSHTLLTTTGAVQLAGTPQIVDFDNCAAEPVLGRSYLLVSATGGIQGTFTGLAEGATIPITSPVTGPGQTLCGPIPEQMKLHYGPRTVTGTIVDAAGGTGEPPPPPPPPQPPPPPPPPPVTIPPPPVTILSPEDPVVPPPTAAPAAVPTTSSTAILRAPRSVSLRTVTHHGVRIRIRRLEPSSVVAVRLREGGRTVGTRRGRATTTGSAVLVLRLSDARARRLQSEHLKLRFVFRTSDGRKHVIARAFTIV